MTWVLVYRPCDDISEHQNAFAPPALIQPLPGGDGTTQWMRVARRILAVLLRVL